MSQIWNSLPDFVCKERIVTSLVEKGKTRDQRVLESIFMIQRKTQARADGINVQAIVESREPTAIDGKAIGKNSKLPTAPLSFDGLAANILFISDVPGYRPSAAANLDGRLTVRIGFSTRGSQEFLQMEFPASVMGAQIDTQANGALHVETRLGSLQRASGIPVAADFQSIEIDGKAYWLPRLVKAEAMVGRDEAAFYVAEYTDCKKFEVTVKVQPVSDIPPR